MVDDIDINPAAALHPVKYIKPPPTARPFEGIGGIGNILEFIEYKAGNNQIALQKTGIGNIGNPAIYDNTGVQYPVITDLLGRSPAEHADFLDLLRTENQPHIPQRRGEKRVNPGDNLAIFHNIADEI